MIIFYAIVIERLSRKLALQQGLETILTRSNCSYSNAIGQDIGNCFETAKVVESAFGILSGILPKVDGARQE